jgi:hypothetical protein
MFYDAPKVRRRKMSLDQTIDQRVTNLEEFYTDLPGLLNARLDGLGGRLGAIEARLDQTDIRIAALSRDTRDIRSGVTLMLKAQDGVVSEQGRAIATLQTDVSGLRHETQDSFAELRQTIEKILFLIEKR